MKIPSMNTVAKTGRYFSAHKADVQTGMYLGLVACVCVGLGCIMIIGAPDFYN